MAELQHMSHKHPLLFNEVTSSVQRDNTYDCAGCEEKVSGPSFSCGDCGFHLHKKCAEAPQEIHHPFHRPHPLVLHPLSELQKTEEKVSCGLCSKNCKGFVYHCFSCRVYLDINCALLPRDGAGNLIETLHVAHQHCLIFIGNANNQPRDFDCACCSSILVDDASYACFDCRIFFHKTCLELPLEISHPYHRKHQLVLESEIEQRDCNLCGEKHRGLFYRCSLCNVDIHIKCAWPTTIIEDKAHHEHPFSLLLRPHCFNCDACGTQGSNVSYICSTCDIQVHKDCISLPRFVRINLHKHPISHSFFCCIDRHDSRTWDCRICYKKVNMEHGCYYCSQPDCDFAIHVKCSIEDKSLYDIIEVESLDVIDEFDLSSHNSIIRVIEETKVGDDVIATKIIHFSHEQHILTFNNEGEDNKHLCDGCVQPISSSFYSCSQCDFVLHKACAERPRKARLWFDSNPFILYPIGIFKCDFCHYVRSGFSYKLDSDDAAVLCLQCAQLPHSFPYQADESHYLFFNKMDGQCISCGRRLFISCRCKDCDFALDLRCLLLPRTAPNKCDRHSLTLAFKDDSDYPLRHYCDICEKRRNPKHWFYHCEVCDSAMHTKCVLGKYPFIKRLSRYRDEGNHPHTLAFVQKAYYYPKCVDCGDPCEDLALECLEQGCNYVVHWKCIQPPCFADTETDSGSDSE